MSTPSPAAEDAPRAQAGRPRRYDEETERRMIFDAALVVLRRNDYQDVSVADILTEAGISTRSFYRHFASKDQLVCALFRRDAERAAERLVARVHDAPTPLAGLEAWIDEILGFSFEVGKARRVAVLGTPGAMRADGYAEEAAHASQLMLAPLLEVLEAGRADGSFPSADPLRDAAMIRAMVWDAAGLPLARHRAASRDEARASLMSFCRRALGSEPNRYEAS